MKNNGASFDPEALRRQFPALSREHGGKALIYLDNACTVLKSARVAEALRSFYVELGACGGKRSTHLVAQAVEQKAQEARETAADFLGAETPNEIVFTSGTTEAVNLVARGFPYEDGRREVVLTDLEHNAVFLPFYEAERRGDVLLKYLRTKDGRVDLNSLERLVTGKTALVCVTRASNVAGGVQPLAEVSRIARKKGAAVFTDCAQFVSSHKEDVRATNVDFAAFSAHKIGGPFGLGVLFGREQWLNRLRHYKVGGGTVKSVVWKGRKPEVTYLDAPQRFEAGVQNYGAFPAFTEAIRLLSQLPQAALRAHVGGLTRRLAEGLSRFSHIRVLGRCEDLAEGSLVSFAPAHPEFSVHDFSLYLNHELPGRFIAVRTGEHCAHLLHQSYGLEQTVRASLFAYNTAAEVDLYLDAVGSYLREACTA